MSIILETIRGLVFPKRDGQPPTSTGGGGWLNANFEEIARRLFMLDAGGNMFLPDSGHVVSGLNNLYLGENNGSATPSTNQIFLGKANTLPQDRAVTLGTNSSVGNAQFGIRCTPAFNFTEREQNPILDVPGAGVMMCEIWATAVRPNGGVNTVRGRFIVSNFGMLADSSPSSGYNYDMSYTGQTLSSTSISVGNYNTLQVYLKLNGGKIYIDNNTVVTHNGSSTSRVTPSVVSCAVQYYTLQGFNGSAAS